MISLFESRTTTTCRADDGGRGQRQARQQAEGSSPSGLGRGHLTITFRPLLPNSYDFSSPDRPKGPGARRRRCVGSRGRLRQTICSTWPDPASPVAPTGRPDFEVELNLEQDSAVTSLPCQTSEGEAEGELHHFVQGGDRARQLGTCEWSSREDPGRWSEVSSSLWNRSRELARWAGSSWSRASVETDGSRCLQLPLPRLLDLVPFVPRALHGFAHSDASLDATGRHLTPSLPSPPTCRSI